MRDAAERLDTLLTRSPEALERGDVDEVLAEVLESVPPLVRAGRASEAEPVVRRAEALATTAGRNTIAFRLRVLLGDAESALGDDESALTWYRSAVSVAQQPDSRTDQELRMYALAQIANFPLSRKDLAGAIAALSDLLDAAGTYGRADYAWPTAAAIARVHLSSRELAQAGYFLDQAELWWAQAEGRSATPESEEDLAAIFAALAWTLLSSGAITRAPRSSPDAPWRSRRALRTPSGYAGWR